MLTLLDEIKMTMHEIDSLNKEIDLMDPKLPENRFKYANKKSEVNALYKKLFELREKLKNENDNNKKIDFSYLNNSNTRKR